MKYRKYFGIVVMLCMLPVTAGLQAQGFSALMKKIQKLESRLNKLGRIERSDIALLQRQISSIIPAESSGADKVAITVLDSKLDMLKAEIEDLKDSGNYEEIKGLAVDLGHLVTELKKNIAVAVQARKQTVRIEKIIEEDKLQISGFVDVSYFYDALGGNNTFGLDQIEIDLEKNFGGCGKIRADLEWVNDGAGGMQLMAEQGFVNWGGFTMGKFNAPVGFELLDAPDMFQFSHALVFNFGLPTNLTGVMYNHDFGKGWDVALHISNGWDQNVDVNTGKTFGTRIGWTFKSKGCLGFSFIRGAQAASEGDFLSLMDIDFTFNPGKALTIGCEFNKGSDYPSGQAAHWLGFLFMTHYDVNDVAGLTFRYDFFDDQDGVRLGSGVAEKRQALTFAPTFSLGEGMDAVVEMRFDLSDQNVFVDQKGNPAKQSFGFALEMIYSF